MWWRTSNCSPLLIYRPLGDERLSWPRELVGCEDSRCVSSFRSEDWWLTHIYCADLLGRWKSLELSNAYMWQRICHQRCIVTSTWNWPESWSCQVTWPGQRLAVDTDNWSSVLVPEETGWHGTWYFRDGSILGRRRSLHSPTPTQHHSQLSGRHPYQVSTVQVPLERLQPWSADPRDLLIITKNEQGRRQEEVKDS